MGRWTWSDQRCKLVGLRRDACCSCYSMSKATRTKRRQAAIRCRASLRLPPSVDPVQYVSLMSELSTQIAQDFSVLRSGGDAAPSTSATSHNVTQRHKRKRQPSPPKDDSTDQDSDRAEATFRRRVRSETTKRKKGNMWEGPPSGND